MSAELLLRKFDRIGDAQGGGPRLRRLILELAMRGDLTGGDTYEWEPVVLRDCATVVNGRAYSQHELLAAGTPVIRIQNLNGGQAWYYSNLDLEPAKYCDPGDLLYAWSATFGPYIWNGPRAIFHYHIWRLALTERADKRFMFHLLQQLTAAIKEEAHGLMVPHMTKQRMETWPVLLPPLAVQRRIVARVDDLMATVDELEAAQVERESRRDRLRAASLKTLVAADNPAPKESARFFLSHSPRMVTKPEHVAGVRQAILDLAVRGRLVAQDPMEEPAAALLGARVVETANNPDLPPGWSPTTLGRLGQVLGGGTPSKSNPDFWIGAIPWVTPKDMKRDRIGDAIDHISKGAVDASGVKRIPTGSLLMVVRGMILNHSFPTALTVAEVTINQDMKALVPFDDRLQGMLLVITKGSRSRILAMVEHSTHGTGRLATSDLFELPISVPPLDEQERVVAKVDELMAVCDELEAALASAQSERSKLLESLLRDALAGSVDRSEMGVFPRGQRHVG